MKSVVRRHCVLTAVEATQRPLGCWVQLKANVDPGLGSVWTVLMLVWQQGWWVQFKHLLLGLTSKETLRVQYIEAALRGVPQNLQTNRQNVAGDKHHHHHRSGVTYVTLWKHHCFKCLTRIKNHCSYLIIRSLLGNSLLQSTARCSVFRPVREKQKLHNVCSHLLSLDG